MPKPEIIDIEELHKAAEEAKKRGDLHDINVVFDDITQRRTEEEAERAREYMGEIFDILNNKR